MSTLLPPTDSNIEMLPPPEVVPNLDDLITEDHKPVDRFYIEKLYRLLTETLYANWSGPGPGRSFLVAVNVGWFYRDKTPPVVPDCMLSLDVTCPDDLHTKTGHSYIQWIIGKPPEVVVEVVSDKKGGEDTDKKELYARLGVSYYAVVDPEHHLSSELLRIWKRNGPVFDRIEPGYWPEIGLGLVLWQGTFERHTDTWLRWCDDEGAVIPTGEESTRRAAERIRELEEALRRRNGPPPEQPPAP
jgi:Uma2 family endonuclease